MHFKLVVAAYNCMEYLPRCLDSIAAQSYGDFDVCVVDDCSTDEEQSLYIKDFCDSHNWKYILNDERRGALYNQVHAIRKMEPEDEDVIVIVDGDDRLAHTDVLDHLTAYYSDGETVLTYGNYRNDPPMGIVRGTYQHYAVQTRMFPRHVIADGSYREFTRVHGPFYNHLRTFKYGLFAQLTDEDFKDKHGEWFRASADTAVMVPLLELSRGHFKFIEEVLLIYTSENPQSDWRVNNEDVLWADHHIYNLFQRKC